MDRNPEAEPAKAGFCKETVRILSGDFFSREKRRRIHRETSNTVNPSRILLYNNFPGPFSVPYDNEYPILSPDGGHYEKSTLSYSYNSGTRIALFRLFIRERQ